MEREEVCSNCHNRHSYLGWLPLSEAPCPFDPNLPCLICLEPVHFISQSGSAICPACDMGKCRYCGVSSMIFKEEIDGGRSLRKWREHMVWHHEKQRR